MSALVLYHGVEIYNGLIRIPNEGCILGNHRVYFGYTWKASGLYLWTSFNVL